mmetsp:Transcript_2751/g.9677  ORF Transcript_2751/g.9677 Transcript_2751/m.9677 type:complete len:208 (-) Transcript_2751:265-888(-)
MLTRRLIWIRAPPDTSSPAAEHHCLVRRRPPRARGGYLWYLCSIFAASFPADNVSAVSRPLTFVLWVTGRLLDLHQRKVQSRPGAWWGPAPAATSWSEVSLVPWQSPASPRHRRGRRRLCSPACAICSSVVPARRSVPLQPPPAARRPWRGPARCQSPTRASPPQGTRYQPCSPASATSSPAWVMPMRAPSRRAPGPAGTRRAPCNT